MNKDGLLPLPFDKRDFQFGEVFTLPKLAELPDEYFLSPLVIKDQKDSDLCTAYASTAVSEDQESVELNPEYQFAKTKQIMGDWKPWGADLRSACKSFTEFGSIDVVPDLPKNPRDWKEWATELDDIAKKHKKQSYFKITGPYDLFDNIRATMWKNRDEKQSVLTGVLWRSSWTSAPNGIIPKMNEPGGFGHAFKICGWTKIGNETRLTAQLSNGEGMGNKGMFYFPREVINRDLIFGSFTFKDMPKEVAQHHVENQICFDRNWLFQLLVMIKNLCKTS